MWSPLRCDLRRRLAAGGRDRGLTLVELLVAMVLLVTVIALTTSVLIQSMGQQSTVSQETEAQNRNQTGIEFAVRMLRQAVYPAPGTPTNSTILSDAEPTKVVFTTQPSSTSSASASCTASSCTNSAPIQNYVLQLGTTPQTATQLMSGSAPQLSPCPPTGLCYGTPTANRTLVYGVQNAGGTSVCPRNTTGTGLFRYFYIDASGSVQQLTATPLSATDLAKVQLIEIDLYTQTRSGPHPPGCVALVDRVQLRNYQPPTSS